MSAELTSEALAGPNQAADRAYQDRILQGVSRTFALTIPALPPNLCTVVGNAYLLCRIADTVEDEPALSLEQKQYFAEMFVAVVESRSSAAQFTKELMPCLSAATSSDEHDLIGNANRVLRMTATFTTSQRQALARCVRVMAAGMSEFQAAAGPQGLVDLAELDRYCYHVAGVVGEMLTELFCEEVESMQPQRERLMPLAVSFGQGLQMTNILKDIWDDYARGVCWLPRDVFARHGMDLAQLGTGNLDSHYVAGLAELIAVAEGHLRNALHYTLSFPAEQKGIRRFCLWALGMAVLTLRKVSNNKAFRSSNEVKIKRSSVRLTVLTINALASNDLALRALFNFWARGLTGPQVKKGTATA